MKKLIGNIMLFFKGLGERKLNVYASSGCYYLFMSLVPIVMIFCCILPYTPLSQDVILGYISQYFSSELGEIVANIVHAIYSSGSATLTISILLTAFSASASMKALMRGMDMAYHTTRKENAVSFSLRALFYMAILVVAAILALVVLVYGKTIIYLILKYIPGADLFKPVLDFILSFAFLPVILILAFLFSLLFKLMPAKKVAYKKQWPGAILTSILWVAFSYLYSWYTTFSNKYGAYGFIGTIMVAMLWIYYCLYMMLIGGYLNSFLEEQKLSQ